MNKTILLLIPALLFAADAPKPTSAEPAKTEPATVVTVEQKAAFWKASSERWQAAFEVLQAQLKAEKADEAMKSVVTGLCPAGQKPIADQSGQPACQTEAKK